jgi:hypothetical protein
MCSILSCEVKYDIVATHGQKQKRPWEKDNTQILIYHLKMFHDAKLNPGDERTLPLIYPNSPFGWGKWGGGCVERCGSLSTIQFV